MGQLSFQVHITFLVIMDMLFLEHPHVGEYQDCPVAAGCLKLGRGHYVPRNSEALFSMCIE